MWSFWTRHYCTVDERWPGTADCGQVSYFVLLHSINSQFLFSYHTLNFNFHFIHRITIQKEKYVHRLLIPSTRMSDAGQYTVVAGGNMSTANLFVEGRDVRIRSIKKEVQVLCTSQIFGKIIHSPLSIMLYFNYRLLNCLTTGVTADPYLFRFSCWYQFSQFPLT